MCFPKQREGIVTNMLKQIGQKNGRFLEMKKLFWWASWSTYPEEFKDQLMCMGQLSEAVVKSLLKYPSQSWCRAYFNTVCKNLSVINNITESFNKWILDARYKPIIKMLETIRVKVMNHLRKHEEKVSSWRQEYSPNYLELYYDFLKIAQVCVVETNGGDGFEVSEGQDKHIVKLEMRIYTCRIWDIFGIPCPHAIKAIQYLKKDPVREIHRWYTKEAYLLTYHHKIQLVLGEKFWIVGPADAMNPPDMVTLARPRIKRIRQKNEASKRQYE
ncbi:uncharacterized protein LOC132062146 [Lycium ferocissimum]|uniref:uncharacterized protein LOC132062146 n=1 Tax=Lycium ferocissimum TaxID=112874 RepID=UPI002815FF01|nr:uncharacterized protein LOC132062146 [Lycium ferocissimum]